MQFADLHPWDLTPSEAVALQRDLAGQVVTENRVSRPVRRVAGVDVSYEKQGELFFAAVVLLSFPDLEPLEESHAAARVRFPYIPGLLSFRELPPLLQAFRALASKPDVILVDGQGIAHPRRLGLASHLGLWLDSPTIGCAKSRLCGDHLPPGPRRGERTPLLLKGEEVGAVLTTRERVRPLFISPGHHVDIDSAVELVLTCGRGYRLPEPTRRAHLLSNRLRREGKAGTL